MNIRWSVIFVVSVLSAVLAGCEQENGAYYRKGTAPGSKNPVEKAVSKDPDDRAKAITTWSAQSWGLQGSYLEYYAIASKSDESAIVRSVAVRALGKAGDPKYLPALVDALRDTSPVVRWDAAVALDNVIGPQAVDPLRKAATTETNLDGRIAAIKALRHYRQENVVQTLIQCLAEGPFGIRYQAHLSLVETTGKDMGMDAEKWKAATASPVAASR